VINLSNRPRRAADSNRNDPFLRKLAESVQQIKDKFEQRQLSTSEALQAQLSS
jgi:hypothetical protein